MKPQNKSSLIRVGDLLEKAADFWPEQPALSFEGRTWNWRETNRRCRGFAAALQQLGVVAGDRVAYLGFNSHRYFECFYAPSLAGAILVPVNFRLSVREMIECVEDAGPKVLIVDRHHVEQARTIQEACACIETLIYADEDEVPQGMLSYESILQQSGEIRDSSSHGDDTLILFYTGGTTGRSKGVMLSHVNFFANSFGTIPLYHLLEGETHLLSGPMFHLAGGSRVFTATAIGGHTVIVPRFDVVEVMRAIEAYKVNMVQFVPTMLQMMIDHPEFGHYDLSSLRMLTYGASPMPTALLTRIIHTFPGIEICQSFGMTEASPVITTLGSEYHVISESGPGKLESVGRPVFHADVRVFDEQGRQLPQGQIGEIVVRGPNVMQGYWQQPDLTAQALKGGWYHTGDAGYFDAQGFLYLAGRKKDMIVSGGENIYPIEVENVVSDHPAVSQCAVIGIPDNNWGEAVHAVVNLRAGTKLTEADLISFCRDRLAHYKCPRSVSIWDEPLPLSTVNKIQKSELRKPFWAGHKSELV